MAARFSASGQNYNAAVPFGAASNYTLCAWVKISVNRVTWMAPFGVDAGSTADSTYFETTNTGLQFRVLFDNTNATNLVNATVGTWYFMAVAQSGTSTTIYWKALGDPSLTIVSDTNAGGPVTISNARIGDWASGGEWLNGCVTGARAWTATLTQTEIEAEAQQLLHKRTANILVSYPLVTAGTADSSGNGFTLTGGVGVTTEAGPAGIPLVAGPEPGRSLLAYM